MVSFLEFKQRHGDAAMTSPRYPIAYQLYSSRNFPPLEAQLANSPKRWDMISHSSHGARAYEKTRPISERHWMTNGLGLLMASTFAIGPGLDKTNHKRYIDIA